MSIVKILNSLEISWRREEILEILDNLTKKYKENNKVLRIYNLGPSSSKLLKKSEKTYDINIF